MHFHRAEQIQKCSFYFISKNYVQRIELLNETNYVLNKCGAKIWGNINLDEQSYFH